MTANILSGEQSNTKMVAVFNSKQAAEDCAKTLKEQGLDPNQLDIVAPNEHHYDRKLEPEELGVKRTAVKAHTRLGILGLVLGCLAWAILYALALPMFRTAPISSLIAFVFVATSAGLILGGFVTMRADHQVVIQEVNEAVHEGLWALLIHSRSREQTHKITQILDDLDVETVRSF